MAPPKPRINCCLCRKRIPAKDDVYPLDAEWQRRFPDMIGTLACHECALGTPWSCLKDHRSFEEKFVEGHIRAVHEGTDKPKPNDFDAWCHVGVAGDHSYAVITFPWSGLVQGSEEYLRHIAHRRGVDADVAQQLQRVLAEWDARKPRTNGRL